MSADKLSVLRARNAEWIQAHAYLDESPINDGESDASLSLADRIAPIVNELISLRATIAALTSSRADLMAQLAACGNAEPPNGDSAAAYRRGWCDAREAAAKLVSWQPIGENPISEEWLKSSNDRDEQIAFTHADTCATLIIALQPPTATTEHDADTLEDQNVIVIKDSDMLTECGRCKNFTRCESLFGCKPDETSCDWSPSRFERA